MDAKRRWEQENKSRRAEINRAADRRRQEWFKALKEKVSCGLCGESEYVCLSFHHIDPNTKVSEVSQMVGHLRLSRRRILDEIAKCVVLCHNCHAKVTSGLISIDSDAATP